MVAGLIRSRGPDATPGSRTCLRWRLGGSTGTTKIPEWRPAGTATARADGLNHGAHHPAQSVRITWQTVVFDALMLTLFVAAVARAVLWHRRGVRIYGFVLIAGLVYGMVLELAGMATLNMYVQGDFPVMINFPALPLFAGTTAMPLYVTLFYPVIFTMGFLVVEALGIPSHWRNFALTGGLFMIFSMRRTSSRNLEHRLVDVGPAFRVVPVLARLAVGRYVLAVDLGATFFYVMLRCRAHLDGDARPWWSTRHALAVRTPAGRHRCPGTGHGLDAAAGGHLHHRSAVARSGGPGAGPGRGDGAVVAFGDPRRDGLIRSCRR